MKTTVKAGKTRATRRDLFAELNEGMAALAGARQGTRTPPSKIGSKGGRDLTRKRRS
jgi:hypothetical protein